MDIDWTHFTPATALGGGMLIGAAAPALLAFNGRIAGISGIVGGTLKPRRGDLGWRLAFIAGLLAAPQVFRLLTPLPASHIDASTPLLLLAGLLVGLGTRYGSGCTSGHGVCGISRLSARSLVATPVFMVAGFVTVYVLRHWLRA